MFKIFKDLYSGSVCVLGWTPQIIQTIFFCKTYSRCRLLEAAVPQTWILYEIWGSISALYKLNNVSDSNDWRAFMIIPIPLAIFRDMHLICSIQFNLLSTIIPKKFALSTSWISAPHIWMVGQTSFLPLGLNIIKFVFSMLRESLLAFNHCMILPSALFTVTDNSYKLFELQSNVVSSANNTEERTFDTEEI